jgi:hypothetical protein
MPRESPASGVKIDEIVLADDPERWDALGFTVADAVVQLGGVRIALAGRDAGKGIVGWSLCGVASTQLDGLSTTSSRVSPRDTALGPTVEADDSPHTTASSARAIASIHPNGVKAIDHVVAMTPNLDRSVRSLQSAGLDLRRIREQPTPAGAPRQAFFRLGPVILEVVQVPREKVERSGGPDGPASFWGLALLADDLSHTVAQLGADASEIRPAVQQGRQIATLRRSAGLAVPVALMSPG